MAKPVKFAHVVYQTRRFDEMIAWYENVLGMRSGWRPAFPFGGAWMYSGDNKPTVHLVEVAELPATADLRLEDLGVPLPVEGPRALLAALSPAHDPADGAAPLDLPVDAHARALELSASIARSPFSAGIATGRMVKSTMELIGSKK